MIFKNIPDLKKARILISNDDGIDAPGIKLLEEEARKVCDDVWVVAPLRQKSGAGHSNTPKLVFLDKVSSIDELPEHIFKIDSRHYAVDGTPADCIHVATRLIISDKLPELVLTGVNEGRNFGEDTTYSGTVGAAIEGLIHGIPAIAFSQNLDKGNVTDWNISRKYIVPILKQLAPLNFPYNTLINVNFPNGSLNELTGFEITRVGEWRFVLKNQIYFLKNNDNYIGEYKPSEKIKDDYVAVGEHKITVTPIKIDMTDYDSIELLREAFEDFKV